MKQVNDVKLPLFPNLINSQFSKESTKMLSNQPSNAFTSNTFLRREGGVKSVLSLLEKKEGLKQ